MATQALSLVCKDCGTLLRSVKEAQDHGEATGHSQFEESTEAVSGRWERTHPKGDVPHTTLALVDRSPCPRPDCAPAIGQVRRLVCVECGKPCRSDTEWDVHQKRTGHSTYTDKARAACPSPASSTHSAAARCLLRLAAAADDSAASERLLPPPHARRA